MHFGLLADRETVEDLDSIAGYLNGSVQELLDISGQSVDVELGPQLV